MKKQTWQSWARGCGADPSSQSKLFKGSLGALTGQDARAMDAFVACLELYALSDDDGQRAALVAARQLLGAMQPKVHWIAQELIPFVLNWEDRERLWPKIRGVELHLVEGTDLEFNSSSAKNESGRAYETGGSRERLAHLQSSHENVLRRSEHGGDARRCDGFLERNRRPKKNRRTLGVLGVFHRAPRRDTSDGRFTVSATCSDCGADSGTVGVIRTKGFPAQMCGRCMSREGVELCGARDFATGVEQVLAVRGTILERIKYAPPDVGRRAILLIQKHDHFDSASVGDRLVVDVAISILDSEGTRASNAISGSSP